MKNLISLLLVGIISMSLCACGSSKEEPELDTEVEVVSEEDNKVIVFKAGETIVTTAADIEIENIEFARRLSLDAGDLYKGNEDPNIHSGLVAGDSQIYVVIDLKIKNTVKGIIDPSDIFSRMVINYADGYVYEHDAAAWLGSAIPMEGTYLLDPLVTEPYRVIFECSEEILNEAETLYLELTLDNGNIYNYPLR